MHLLMYKGSDTRLGKSGDIFLSTNSDERLFQSSEIQLYVLSNEVQPYILSGEIQPCILSGTQDFTSGD